MISPTQAQAILQAHDTYWESKRERLRDCKKLYMTDFWRHEAVYDAILRTEVPKAYQVVESYLGSLYAKNPAVVVEPDLRRRGNPDVAEATANQYLLTVRQQLEDATRMALIYPCSFIKLAPVVSTDPLKRVAASALPPWEVVVDDTATSWEQQRWVGHVYLMPIPEAAQQYGKGQEEFRARSYTRWLEQDRAGLPVERQVDLRVDEGWVRVLELYDLEADKLLVWSPDYQGGRGFLFEGIKVQVGALDPDAGADVSEAELEAEEQHETTGIPFKTTSGRPVVPILPLYFSRDPDVPLRGYALVDRSFDQFRELNLMRTYQAQGVRRMARQWLVRQGFLSDDAAAKVTAGLDGEFIEVDLAPGSPLEGNMLPVPQAPIPADIQLYAQTVQQDISDAGLLAPFTRGEVTKSTATEQNLLAAYTSSEVGRMARTRDGLITELAKTYNIMLSVVLGDEAEPLALPNPVGPTMLSAEDLTGDFAYWAVDAGTTPMGDLQKQQSLQALAPLLVQLGADPALIREELVRVYQLPERLAQPPEAPEAQPGAPSPMGEMPPGVM